MRACLTWCAGSHYSALKQLTMSEYLSLFYFIFFAPTVQHEINKEMTQSQGVKGSRSMLACVGLQDMSMTQDISDAASRVVTGRQRGGMTY